MQELTNLSMHKSTVRDLRILT